MVKSIYLQDGEEIFVDDEDFESVSHYKWYKTTHKNSRTIGSFIKNKKISLADFILKNHRQKEKNNDFTRSNLTEKGNQSKWAKAQSNSSSKYKGVTWHKNRNKWTANIHVEGKIKSLGSFLEEDDAAKAYNQAVLEYWNGEGYINKIGKDNRAKPKHYRKHKNQRVQYHTSLKLGFKGVSRNKNNSNPYTAYIKYNKKMYFISVFDRKHKAALAFNKCAIYLHGEDAILNEVPITEDLKEFISNWEIPDKILELKLT